MAHLCRVALALALTARLPAAAEPWVDCSSNGQATGVLHGTGCHQMDVLEAVWTKYRAPLLMQVKNYKGFMVAKKQGAYQLEERVGFAMYVALNYAHQYPSVVTGAGWAGPVRLRRRAGWDPVAMSATQYTSTL
jgi:hypothetical protein